MKTDKLFKTISKYSLQRPSQEADDRIEEILKERINIMQTKFSTPESRRSFSALIWKYSFSAVAGIAVIIVALNLSFSKEAILLNRLTGTTNFHFVNFSGITNENAQCKEMCTHNLVSTDLITSPEISCERVSLNCWEMVSN